MEKNELLDKLNKIAKTPTSWMEEAKFRIENRKNIEQLKETELRILRELRASTSNSCDRK